MSLYGLAAPGVFETVQGEGVLLGVPMVFVRFAGCPVACPQCDTDYRAAERITALAITKLVCAAASPRTEWVFLTGGEPMIYDVAPIADSFRRLGFRVAMVTSGEFPVPAGMVDFLSVSPHRLHKWVQRTGNQVNIVPGLHGLTLSEIDPASFERFPPSARFVTPLSGDPAAVAECRAFAVANGWRLGVQAHLTWRLP